MMGRLLDDLKIAVQESRINGLRPDIIRIKLKEELQLYLLDFIYNSLTYKDLIMYGGTCLRICFDLNRMSEDIDFETTKSFSKEQFSQDVRNYFVKNVRYKSVKTHVPGVKVSRVELRFPVLYELGLSAHEDENLIVKVEVNSIGTVYPAVLKTVAKGRFGFVIRHYDPPTLMAGKMLACLERVWEKRGVRVKGRDYYDLIWYMQNGIVPNPIRLADSAGKYTVEGAFEQLQEKVNKIKTDELLMDLGPLFENPDFPQRWVAAFKEQFEQLYLKYKTAKK